MTIKPELELLEQHVSFGGTQSVFRHQSQTVGGPMTFAVFVPPQTGPLPVVTYLSGLTCTHANVMDKGEYRRVAAQLGLIVVCPDTSPRGEGVPDDEAYDLGQGAGFYIDADERPYKQHYRMWSYITRELPALIQRHFDVDRARQGIFGHSMGGHGALTIGLTFPEVYRSVSAFSPIVAPSQVPWGQKAFTAYLGGDPARWRAHDAVALIEDGKRVEALLVDVGLADPFLERELKPELLEAACAGAGVDLTLRRHPGYDHSYLFISTLMEDHLRWHAERLKRASPAGSAETRPLTSLPETANV
ncbi:S-formylglutathione hydrolase [Caulobacter sp. AP07]|uniref:S-formylglutathione hydrolase n=1 Tax=Caulobacter sp. AP07 TaxID=1144304 RepID=UPI000271E8C1|nr:S-formylglutathione hydrolase [Caulobacter sp. AP07]EJL30764.1 S-formylglutathione hydrolase [Caulobacter sp. AP07]